jgi:hypothetical protein
MHSSRTAVDWLIVIVNIVALLFGLAIGWLWIVEAAGHYAADDSHPNLRIGMCIGFIMAYLAWNSVVTTYLILKIRALVTQMQVEAARSYPAPSPIGVQPLGPVEATKSSPPPVRATPAGSASASSVPAWVDDIGQARSDIPELANNQSPPPASWIPDVASEEQARRSQKD